MPAMARRCAWDTPDHGMAQTGSKASYKRLVAHLPDSNQGETHLMSSPRTVRGKAHRLRGQHMDLRYPQAVKGWRRTGAGERRAAPQPCGAPSVGAGLPDAPHRRTGASLLPERWQM